MSRGRTRAADNRPPLLREFEDAAEQLLRIGSGFDRSCDDRLIGRGEMTAVAVALEAAPQVRASGKQLRAAVRSPQRSGDLYMQTLLDRAAAAGPGREDAGAAVVAAYGLLDVASTHRIAERLRGRSERWAEFDPDDFAELAGEVLAEVRRGVELLVGSGGSTAGDLD